MAGALSVVLRYTAFGRHVFALGSNEQTARLCGLNVPALKVAVYTLGGMFIGLAGVYQFAKLKVGNPTSGLGMELKVIAAVVIGGASLFGGSGTIIGTVIGALIIAVIQYGLVFIDVEPFWQFVAVGVVIIVSVVVDQSQSRLKGELQEEV